MEAAVDEVQVVSEAVGVTIARRIREVRKARAWSQDDLAARIREIGGRISRPVLYRIEEGGTRARRLSVEEFLVIAAALGVAPLYHMTDTSDAPGRQTVLTTKIAMEPRSARAWMAGTGNPPGEESMRVYISQRPESELVEMHKDWAANADDLRNREGVEILDPDPREVAEADLSRVPTLADDDRRKAPRRAKR